ncbi:LysR family transcriptional regulator [Nitratireductor sp. CAU 1489]|uniref:LysR family transcriptional regulator n=1 Tax=Nitratireductor arenosus TaxID=2682096 RepID=A0A844QFI4_9HYPH|nr:LysR substrate-binding domain-containing protein [Nitratireductor arenosus]MVA98726.1 LysR family transcriptional regulator [Nitratireductor arenosus]
MRALNSIHLSGLRAVEAVARTGSLQAAAQELGVSASAVSQQVNRTEKQLGKTLFARTGRGMEPSGQADIFFERLGAGFAELTSAVEWVRRQDQCTLVVSVAPVFASKWLIPRLGRMFALHPGILVRIDTTTRLADLAHSDVDVAIRLGDGDWAGTRAELLFSQDIFPVCAPALAERLKTIPDLAHATKITDEAALFGWEDWFAAAGAAPVALKPGVHFRDPLLCLDGAICGHGVMLAWQLLAGEAVADGRLVAPFDARAPSGLGYWLCTESTQTEAPKVRAFKRWILEEVQNDGEAGQAGLQAALPHAEAKTSS